ncbi:serine/threonine-protein phosphatase 7 long form-like protein [Trifolium medium]|uniref:Serine/threonine-protein phosphatase 7 long form-like protein n=1 Tax=Trifolium medium TaxID=97028 RepID=A0A392LZ76_9FABA|nr:serine/threonine-protein phosphatase 7 long form-like protein [Trifolium medium]
MMEVREDFMTSPAGDSQPTFRTAHFLKPLAKSIHELTLNEFNLNPSSSSTRSVFESNEGCFEIHFNGWRYHPLVKWVKWVDQLQLKYEPVWKKAGIFEDIMSTKSHIINNKDLVYGVVEKWCSETNTFVFPFGEATITLEDVMVLGGYPVLGDPIFTSLEDQ